MHDAEILQAVQSGKREAFGLLVERYQERIFRLCYHVAGNAVDAEDLAHESFVEAYLKLPQLRDPEKFGPWLSTLALNLCRMWYRQQERHVVDCLPESLAQPEDEENPLHERMFQGLARLSGPHRMALVLHYWEGLSYDEVARFLGVPLGTVMSRLHRARHELKRSMETMTDEEIPALPDDDFRREVEAEIAALLTLFKEDPESRERLSIILHRSPERFVQLIAEAAGDAKMEDLALLVRRLGPSAITVAVESAYSAEPGLREQAQTLLLCIVARSKPEYSNMTRMASKDAYLVLDALMRTPADANVKASLMLRLLEACTEERAALLFTNALLCDPDAAFPLLLERFWSAASPEALYKTGDVLYALCRTGARFAAKLVEPLRTGTEREQTVALAGAEALGRALNLDWFDAANESDERIAQEARFRRKWAPPLKQDRDPAVLAEFAEATAAFLDDDRPAFRESAIRVLGLLRSEDYVDALLRCIHDPAPAVRLTALRALDDTRSPATIPALMETARTARTEEKQIALRVLGTLKAAEARSLLRELAEGEDRQAATAALLALGEIGGEASVDYLRSICTSKGADPRKGAAARALAPHLPKRSTKSDWSMADVVRDGAKPYSFIALDAAIRALPEHRPYPEAEISRLIATACIDFASARRYLIEFRLMSRTGGVYTFTEYGSAAWRVEHRLRADYMRAAPIPLLGGR